MSENATTILIVDDNADDVFALQRALRKAAVANPIRVVSNGRQAIDYLSGAGDYADREQSPLPGLIFLDLKMPLSDGFDVLTWMRQHPEMAGLPVVVLSGSDEPKDHQRAYALGARTYLIKPPDATELRAILDARQNLWNAPPEAPRNR